MMQIQLHFVCTFSTLLFTWHRSYLFLRIWSGYSCGAGRPWRWHRCYTDHKECDISRYTDGGLWRHGKSCRYHRLCTQIFIGHRVSWLQSCNESSWLESLFSKLEMTQAHLKWLMKWLKFIFPIAITQSLENWKWLELIWNDSSPFPYWNFEKCSHSHSKWLKSLF